MALDEEADLLVKRGMEKRLKGQKKWIDTTLNERPDLVPTVVQHIRSKGYNNNLPTVKEEDLASAAAETTPTKVSRSLALAVSPPPSVAGSGAETAEASAFGPALDEEVDLDDDEGGKCSAKILSAVPRKYLRIIDFPPGYIASLLTACEAVSMNPRNLTALVTGKSKYIRNEPLLDFLEYITGLDRGQPILSELRMMVRFNAVCNEFNINRGRLGRDLVLPVDWQQEGFFMLSVDSQSTSAIMVIHKETSETRAVDIYCMKIGTASVDAKLFSIDANYNEHKAALQHPASAHRVYPQRFFDRTAEAATPAAIAAAGLGEPLRVSPGTSPLSGSGLGDVPSAATALSEVKEKVGPYNEAALASDL